MLGGVRVKGGEGLHSKISDKVLSPGPGRMSSRERWSPTVEATDTPSSCSLPGHCLTLAFRVCHPFIAPHKPLWISRLRPLSDWLNTNGIGSDLTDRTQHELRQLFLKLYPFNLCI